MQEDPAVEGTNFYIVEHIYDFKSEIKNHQLEQGHS